MIYPRVPVGTPTTSFTRTWFGTRSDGWNFDGAMRAVTRNGSRFTNLEPLIVCDPFRVPQVLARNIVATIRIENCWPAVPARAPRTSSVRMYRLYCMIKLTWHLGDSARVILLGTYNARGIFTRYSFYLINWNLIEIYYRDM